MQIKRTIEVIGEFPGIGQKIRNARESDTRSLSQICRECGISRTYWYQLENENLLAPATEEIIRKIEKVLSVDLGVKFDNYKHD
ncbi:transcriptional regulator [Scytonema sp. UIC 10036]|nr:transcriptional regulator [Scytonema sp. UIC 10036]